MAYNEKYGGGIPPIPSSLNTATPWQDVNLHNDTEKDDQIRSHPDTDPEVTPYLGMRARLSQLWFNRWTILLLLVLIRVILLTGSLNENLGDAKIKALSACTKVEDVGSAMASMPHYMSKGVNALAAASMQKAIDAMASLLKMILTAVQTIIIFVLNMYIGTFTCLVAAFIHGGLHVATEVVEGATDMMNQAIGAVTNGLAQDVKKFQDMINNVKDLIQSGFNSVGKELDLPDINIDNRLRDLKGVKIDATNVIKGIDTLDKNIPTFDQAKNMAESAIAIPFNMVKGEIDGAFGRFKVTPDTFPVAEKQALSFCSDNSFLNDFFESLFSIVHKGKIAFFVVIIILAVLAMVVMGFLEYHQWQREKKLQEDIDKFSVNNQDSIYMASRRWTARAGFSIANMISSEKKGKNWLLVRWAVAYATSLPALFVLSLAIAGFFSCFCQWVILRQIEAKAPELAAQVGDFAGDVVGTLKQVSENWAESSNQVILKMESDINKDVFGWINEAVKSVNDTLTTVENELDHALIKVFDKTVLLDTARDVVACLVGNKIDDLQKGLTWIHNHTKVELPKFDNNIFSTGAVDNTGGDNDINSFLAKPGAVTTDEINEAVGKVIRSLRNGIIQEALISLGLLLLYIIVVLIGVMGALIGMATPSKNRGEGGGPGFKSTSSSSSFHDHNGFDPALAPSNAMVNNPSSPHYPSEKYGGGDNLHPNSANNRNGGNDNADMMYGEASPAYEEVVYAGRVPAGKTRELITRYHPGHERTSSYPTVESPGYLGEKKPGYFTPV